MVRRTVIVFTLVVLAAVFATSQVPNPGNSSAGTNTASIEKNRTPDPPPLPPDVKTPDAPPGGDPKATGNPVTRTLKRLAPNCINSIFHACWSSPPQKPQPPQTDERKGAASREVGEFYLERGNYHAAESRFRDALQLNPNDARAMFDLGRSLESLGRTDEAIVAYDSCENSQHTGDYAERSRKAVERLTTRAGTPSK